MPEDRSDEDATPPSEEDAAASSDGDGTEPPPGSFDTTPDAQAPTADLRAGEESSERLDAAFALLADSVRRDALYHLAENDGRTIPVESLAEAVASKRVRGDAADARSLAVELHHAHLPKLESHGVVQYDPSRRSVEYRGHEWLKEWLDHARQAESK
jgi:DNA-binding transcriptional ArsR family regulator